MEIENIEIEAENGQMRSGGKRKGPGFGAGLLVGVLGMGLILFGGSKLFCRITGQYLIIGSHSSNMVPGSEILNQETADKIEELADYMNLYYYEDYEEQEVRNNLYKGLMEGLNDPYSVYYTEEEYTDLQISTTGTYYGIGAGLSQDADSMQVTVIKVYEGTPAEEAGLKKDDVILMVQDIDATSMELTDLVKEIRGEEGTTVHLKVYRASTEEILELDVERRNVELPSVNGQMLDNHIGYIQISEFQTNTAVQFKQILKELQEQNMESLIVDVRSNPGGMLDVVVEVLDEILPEGLVVYMQDKYGNRRDYNSDSNCLDCPIAVLMDENSASAAEIFAGAIKDYEYGTLIGTKTFGKGIVQTVFPLEDGDALKITTAKYFTPKGNYIHGVGIDPDIALEYEYTGPENGEYEMQYDNQLQKAIEVLTNEG